MVGNKEPLLFREEARLSSLHQQLGTIEFGKPHVKGYVIALVLFASISFSLLLILGKVGRHTSLSGTILPPGGVRQVTALRPGTVNHLAVLEGDYITEGQLILGLSTSEIDLAGKSISLGITNRILEQISHLEKAIDLLDIRYQQESDQILSEISYLDKEVELLNATAESALGLLQEERKQAEASTSLYQRSAISEMALSQAVSEYYQVRQSAFSTELNSLSQQKLLNNRVHALTQLPTDISERKIDLQRQKLQLEQSLQQYVAQNESGVISPWSGRVSSLLVEDGDTVASGETVATITANDDTDLVVAKLWVPSGAIADLDIGNEVALAVDSYPVDQYGRLKGVVTNISDMPILRQFDYTSVLSEPSYYEAYVDLYEPAEKRQNKIVLSELKSGVRVTAEVTLGKISLFNQILDPLIKIYKDVI